MVHPPTPHPASTKLRTKIQKEPRDTAFREITTKANASVASEQTCSNKPDGCLTGARKERRVKNSSCSKPDVNGVRENKSRISNRPSTPGVPTSKSVRIRTSGLIVRNGLAVANNRTTSTTTCASKVSQPTESPKIQLSITEKPCEKKSLNSAHYWLEQVKLAEQLEKHAVALGFFRLAVECDAEPMDLLREELIAYQQRYSLCSAGIRQVLMSYGVAEETQEADHSGKPEKMDDKERLIEEKRDPEQDNEDVYSSISSENLGNMDVDSLTREVVTYIMSSMDELETSPAMKSTTSSVDFQTSSYSKNNIPTKGFSLSDNSQLVIPVVQGENIDSLANESGESTDIGSEGVRQVADSEDESPTASDCPPTSISTFRVGSMDADSLTREVVSCIMSSMYDLDNSPATKKNSFKAVKGKDLGYSATVSNGGIPLLKM